MNLTLIAWTVFALGFGALIGAEQIKTKDSMLHFIGASALLWAIGVGIWEVVAWIV